MDKKEDIETAEALREFTALMVEHFKPGVKSRMLLDDLYRYDEPDYFEDHNDSGN